MGKETRGSQFPPAEGVDGAAHAGELQGRIRWRHTEDLPTRQVPRLKIDCRQGTGAGFRDDNPPAVRRDEFTECQRLRFARRVDYDVTTAVFGPLVDLMECVLGSSQAEEFGCAHGMRDRQCV